MNVARLKHPLEVVTNVAVLIAAVVTITFFARAYVSSNVRRSPAKLPAEIALGDLENFNYADSPRTLILALSTGCKYCYASVPFYQTLLAKQQASTTPARIIAVFPETGESVKAFLQKTELKFDYRAGTDFSKLHVSSTPTLILVDSSKNIVDSWIGALSHDSEDEVLKAVANGNVPATNTTEYNRAISLFDERSPLLTIEPAKPEKDESPQTVNFFDVDQHGNIYLATSSGLVKYNSQGERVAQTKLPEQFRGVFCVDGEGNTYLPDNTSLLKYDSALRHHQQIPVPNIFTKGIVVLKMEWDGPSNGLYIQTYDPANLNQVLYKYDLGTLKAHPLYKLEKPAKFSPTFTAGAFDFAIGSDSVFISDLFEYKVHIYSLSTGKYVKSFSRPFTATPISENDGALVNRHMRIGGLANSPNSLKNYPPILQLNVAENGYLVVWTSHRNSEHKQIVDVYDKDLKLVGTDFKYAHPTINNHLFKNGNVYIPDFGFGKNLNAPDLSPLEVPSLPLSLKVFRFAPTTTKPQ